MNEAANRLKDVVPALSCVTDLISHGDNQSPLDMEELTYSNVMRLLVSHDVGTLSPFNWRWFGDHRAVIAPPVLRSGEFYRECGVSSRSGVILRISAWLYLASKLDAFWRSYHRTRSGSAHEHFGGSRSLLVELAQAHRYLLSIPCLDCTVAGELTALTAATDAAIYCDDYLVTVAKLADAEDGYEGLATRAWKAISPLNRHGVKHTIIMTNNIPSAPLRDEAVLECLPSVVVTRDLPSVQYV
ncbi:hypothetical protein [uncultured Bradyrhizobium sp.]|uniref:hypothetical protein n=1 Tax=uncultured Bradyrhizobium sp. TaxID=199684 RepID=UPI0035CB2716